MVARRLEGRCGGAAISETPAHSGGSSDSTISAPAARKRVGGRLRAPPCLPAAPRPNAACGTGRGAAAAPASPAARRGSPSSRRGTARCRSTERAMMPTVSRRLGVDLHAGRREQAEARLEADDAAIGRRPDHRAAGLRADRQRHHEIGDRRGRAARRAAGRDAPGCAGWSVGPGWRLANSVVTVLPSSDRRRRRAAGSRRWRREAGRQPA